MYKLIINDIQQGCYWCYYKNNGVLESVRFQYTPYGDSRFFDSIEEMTETIEKEEFGEDV